MATGPERRKKRFRSATDLGQAIFDLHNFSINPHSREIYLHPYLDNLDDDAGEVEFRMSATFVKNINLLNNLGSSNILIHQQTIGGNWCDGMAIFNAICFSKSSVSIIGYAHVRSMSSITFQAADKRVLMPDTEVVVHLGFVGGEDRSRAMYEYIASAKKADDRMLEIYSKRCVNGKFFKERGDKEKQVYRYIKDKVTRQHDDWIMTAEEATYYGFADGVFGQKGFETVEKIRKTTKNRVF